MDDRDRRRIQTFLDKWQGSQGNERANLKKRLTLLTYTITDHNLLKYWTPYQRYPDRLGV